MARPAGQCRNNVQPARDSASVPFGTKSTEYGHGASTERLSHVDRPFGGPTNRITPVRSGTETGPIPNPIHGGAVRIAPTFRPADRKSRSGNQPGPLAGSHWRGGESAPAKASGAGLRPDRTNAPTTAPGTGRGLPGPAGTAADQYPGRRAPRTSTMHPQLSTVDWSRVSSGPYQCRTTDSSGRKRRNMFTLIARHQPTHVCTTTAHSPDGDSCPDQPFGSTLRDDRGHRCHQGQHQGPRARYPRLSSSIS